MYTPNNFPGWVDSEIRRSDLASWLEKYVQVLDDEDILEIDDNHNFELILKVLRAKA